ncbi:hypothetical protein [Sinomonas sp. ASV322]|uniref:hypothetical protein n=1 Tax=Sinomonas sp. ASV322 TaxID=3041920 RepID=UPI0027DD9866|nr:hypothetical protein [Sinomonas sp. ASV322]MDQ4501355.1 hypothetical protein [Sinomonas sp. ASV322]
MSTRIDHLPPALRPASHRRVGADGARPYAHAWPAVCTIVLLVAVGAGSAAAQAASGSGHVPSQVYPVPSPRPGPAPVAPHAP